MTMIASRNPAFGPGARQTDSTGQVTGVTTLDAPQNAAEWSETLRDGSHVTIRMLRKDDEAMERSFIERLSPESRRMRFLGQIGGSDEAFFHKLTDIDYRRDMAFVALAERNGVTSEIGVSRYALSPDGKSCECAVTVSDEWQGKGLGTVLMRHLIDIARERGIATMISLDPAENWRMHELARDLGFIREPDPDDPGQVIHRLAL
jgi:GNAT superfamily N-acetyltransferase